MAEPDPRFYAFACAEGRCRAHHIPQARDHQDAAIAFAAHWTGPTDGDLAVVVLEATSGEERRFRIALED